VQNPRTVIGEVWRRLPPGVFIAMMGLLAALYPIAVSEPIPPKEKAMWIALFFLLMVLEILVIFKERASQDRSFIDQLTRLDTLESLHRAQTAAIERVRHSVNDGSLRDRALRLSESIITFTTKREEQMNRLPPDHPMSGSSREMLADRYYRDSTVLQYHDKFDAELGDVGREFRARQIGDSRLDAAINSPDDLRVVSDTLVDMVGKLRD
jgi:hypothetical protein